MTTFKLDQEDHDWTVLCQSCGTPGPSSLLMSGAYILAMDEGWTEKENPEWVRRQGQFGIGPVDPTAVFCPIHA